MEKMRPLNFYQVKLHFLFWDTSYQSRSFPLLGHLHTKGRDLGPTCASADLVQKLSRRLRADLMAFQQIRFRQSTG